MLSVINLTITMGATNAIISMYITSQRTTQMGSQMLPCTLASLTTPSILLHHLYQVHWMLPMKLWLPSLQHHLHSGKVLTPRMMRMMRWVSLSTCHICGGKVPLPALTFHCPSLFLCCLTMVHVMLIHTDLVMKLGFCHRLLPEPETVDVAVKSSNALSYTTLTEWVKLFITSLDDQWTFWTVHALIALNLCTSIILRLPFLTHNSIVTNHAAHTCINKWKNYDLLNPLCLPLPKCKRPKLKDHWSKFVQTANWYLQNSNTYWALADTWCHSTMSNPSTLSVWSTNMSKHWVMLQSWCTMRIC